jgi:TPR repeat protein
MFFGSTLYADPKSDALAIVTSEKLSNQQKFSAMTILAYKDNQDPQAFFMLYNMLYYGQGTPTSPDTALTMLTKSALNGYGVAQEELAFIYLTGNEYYPKDISLAYHWLKKAAKSGMVKSKKYLNS